MPIVVAALYHFARLADPARARGPLARLAGAAGLRGTLLLAPEGINGTVAGPREGIDALLAHLRALPGFSDLSPKESAAETMPFGTMKVRLKREIVTMGQPDVDPRAAVGHYVEPCEWNALIRAPDVVVIDTRNDYEVAIGSFAGAIDPGTRRFRDFPAWWDQNAARFAGKRVAMFCTGGIRCEKATNWLLSRGVEDVFHLRGGVLKYLEEMPEADSLWQGECFVFDRRVSLTHGLRQGRHGLCHGCRRPLAPEDQNRPDFENGVSCHRCAAERTDADRARFRERQRQIRLAEGRHGGGGV